MREQRLAGIAGNRDVLHAHSADRVVHPLRIDAEQRRELVKGEVQIDAGARRLLHLADREIDERAEGVIDHGAFEAELVDQFCQGPDLRVGRMAEEQRGVVIGDDADHLLVERLQPPALVQHVVSELERLLPRQGLRVRPGIGGRVHPDRLAADLIVRVRVIEDRQPNRVHAIRQVLLQLFGRRRLVVHRHAVSGPAPDRRDA